MSIKHTVIVTDRTDGYFVAHHQYESFSKAIQKYSDSLATFAVGIKQGTHHAELITSIDAPAPGANAP